MSGFCGTCVLVDLKLDKFLLDWPLATRTPIYTPHQTNNRGRKICLFVRFRKIPLGGVSEVLRHQGCNFAKIRIVQDLESGLAPGYEKA